MKDRINEYDLFFFKTRKFFDWIRTRKGKNFSNIDQTEDATVEAYRDALTIFRRFICDEKGWSVSSFSYESCSRDLILEYIRYLQQKNMKPSTINQRLAALKSYLWFCSDDDIALQPLSITVSRIPNVKEPKLIRERLSDNDLKLLFEAPENDKRGIRDRTIMILLYDSAIRVSELTGLNIGDIRIDDGYSFIRVHGKGNKEREISIGSRTSDHLRLYNSMYNSDADKKDPLFYTVYKGVKGRMSAGNVERIIRKYADIARKSSDTMPMNVYPHMFRRTRATNLYQNGVELDLVSRTLGHEQIETTRSHYALPSEEMLRKSMEKAGTNMAEPEWADETDDKILKYLGLR